MLIVGSEAMQQGGKNGGGVGYAIGYATRADSEGLGKLPVSCQGVALRKQH